MRRWAWPDRPMPKSANPPALLLLCGQKSLDQLPSTFDHDGWWCVSGSLRARQVPLDAKWPLRVGPQPNGNPSSANAARTSLANMPSGFRSTTADRSVGSRIGFLRVASGLVFDRGGGRRRLRPTGKLGRLDRLLENRHPLRQPLRRGPNCARKPGRAGDRKDVGQLNLLAPGLDICRRLKEPAHHSDITVHGPLVKFDADNGRGVPEGEYPAAPARFLHHEDSPVSPDDRLTASRAKAWTVDRDDRLYSLAGPQP